MYDHVLSEVEKVREFADSKPDVDYQRHVDELTKSHLSKTEWSLEPLQNPENNFVEDLISRYLDEL